MFSETFDVLWSRIGGKWNKKMPKIWNNSKIAILNIFWIILKFFICIFYILIWILAFDNDIIKFLDYHDKTEIRSPGWILMVIGLEIRGFEVFQNFVGRERTACLANLCANLLNWQLNLAWKKVYSRAVFSQWAFWVLKENKLLQNLRKISFKHLNKFFVTIFGTRFW